MKIIAIEEHFTTPAINQTWQNHLAADSAMNLHLGEVASRLKDLGTERLQLMDESGIDVQVLSLTSPGVHNLKENSVPLAIDVNDFLSEVIRQHPDRFQGMATLPTPVPAAAPKELERCVRQLGFNAVMLCGRTEEKNLDHKDFFPMFEAAEALGVPLQIHPQIPQKGVRDAYYSGFDDFTNLAFSTFGLGWHYEAGIQFVRMVVAGVFDQFPGLQIILGHWGEVVLFFAERMASLARIAKLKRPFSEYIQNNLYITGSGMFSQRYLQQTIDIVGIDRILFSQDYPYQYRPGREARNFLEATILSETDKAKFAYQNWENLIQKIAR